MKKDKRLQTRGAAEHAHRMAIRKHNRDRRTPPEMTPKRAEMMIAVWGASEYARVYGVGLKKNLSREAFPYLFEVSDET